MKIRTSAGLVLYNTPNGMFLQNSLKHRRADSSCLTNPLLSSILTKCATWQDYNIVCQYIQVSANVSESAASNALDHLLEFELLETESTASVFTPSDEAAERWISHGWADAMYFHAHTNALPKADYSQPVFGEYDQDLMRRYVANESPPDNFKGFSGDTTINLERLHRASPPSAGKVFDGSLELKKGTLDATTLGWFMHLSFGQTGTRKLPVSGSHITKTSPSGGSRHPIEVYPVVVDIPKLPNGAFHYDVKHHGLSFVRRGDFGEFVKKHVITRVDRPAFDFKLALIFTAVVDRSMFRYRDSRSYRVIHFDLGHLLQTCAFTACSFGLRSYRGYSLHERTVEDFLQVDGLMETALAFAVIG